MKHYKKALKILPEFPNVHNNIGLILMNDDNLSEAIKHFEKAINFDPKFSEAHNNLGATLQKNKKIDGAIQHFKKAIEINPNYDQAYNNLGIMFQSLGDEKNAKKNFENAIKAYASSIKIHSDFDFVCFGGGNFSKIEEDLFKSLSLNRNKTCYILVFVEY